MNLHVGNLYIFLPQKRAGGIALGSVAIFVDVSLYISMAIKARFLKLGICNICKYNIAKMFLDFIKLHLNRGEDS